MNEPLLQLVRKDLPLPFTLPKLASAHIFKPTLIGQRETLMPTTKQKMTRKQKKRLKVLDMAKVDASKAHERRLERRRQKQKKAALTRPKKSTNVKTV